MVAGPGHMWILTSGSLPVLGPWDPGTLGEGGPTSLGFSFLTCNSWDGAMRGELKWRVEESAEGPQKWCVITPYYCCYESGPVKNVGLTEGSPLES